jgi:hypothetical protein
MNFIPVSVQQKFAGIPRSIRSLAIFYNPNTQDEWENIMGEATVMVRETTEAAYLATVNYGNPEPKNFRETQVLIFQIGGKLFVLNLGTWSICKFGK